jgi:hypothetical protein
MLYPWCLLEIDMACIYFRTFFITRYAHLAYFWKMLHKQTLLIFVEYFWKFRQPVSWFWLKLKLVQVSQPILRLKFFYINTKIDYLLKWRYSPKVYYLFNLRIVEQPLRCAVVVLFRRDILMKRILVLTTAGDRQFMHYWLFRHQVCSSSDLVDFVHEFYPDWVEIYLALEVCAVVMTKHNSACSQISQAYLDFWKLLINDFLPNLLKAMLNFLFRSFLSVNQVVAAFRCRLSNTSFDP